MNESNSDAAAAAAAAISFDHSKQFFRLFCHRMHSICSVLNRNRYAHIQVSVWKFRIHGCSAEATRRALILRCIHTHHAVRARRTMNVSTHLPFLHFHATIGLVMHNYMRICEYASALVYVCCTNSRFCRSVGCHSHTASMASFAMCLDALPLLLLLLLFKRGISSLPCKIAHCALQ